MSKKEPLPMLTKTPTLTVVDAAQDALLTTLLGYHPGTYEHCLGVEDLARQLAFHVNYSWTIQELDDLCFGARLHDIGKLRIPLAILDKPGKLTADEFAYIQTHPRAGVDILVDSGVDFPRLVHEAVYHHHSAYAQSAKGYPDNVKGEDIPLGARIVAVADIFDALIRPRSYKPASPLAQAVSILRDEAEKKLDPQLVHTFITHVVPTLA